MKNFLIGIVIAGLVLAVGIGINSIMIGKQNHNREITSVQKTINTLVGNFNKDGKYNKYRDTIAYSLYKSNAKAGDKKYNSMILTSSVSYADNISDNQIDTDSHNGKLKDATVLIEHGNIKIVYCNSL